MKNVRWPEEDHDLVNGAYVYFVPGKRLPLEGGVMQGQIDMGKHSIRNISPAPINEDEVISKQWIENNFFNHYSSASTMARDLNMDGHHVSYLRVPEQNHHAATKGYADTKLPLLGRDMQGGIGMGGNRISHLGEPEQDNDAVRLRFVNDYFLKRDRSNWMRNDLSVGGHRVTGMANLQSDQDAVNKRTLDDMIQAPQLYFEEHFVSADAVSQLRGPVSFNSQSILNLGHPIDDDDAVNLRTLKIEISQNNMMKLPKYLRLDGSSEPTNDRTMSNHRLKNLKDPINPKHAATKKYVDDLITNPVAATPVVVSADLYINNFKITNLKNPTDGQDATNQRFVERNFVRKDQDINMRDHKTTGLHPLDVTQSDQSDAAPKGYDREIFRQIDENNRVEAVKFLKVHGTSLPEANRNFNGQKIKNLGRPVDPNDAATVNFVDYRIGQRTFHVNLEGAQEKLKMNNNVIPDLRIQPNETMQSINTMSIFKSNIFKV